MTEQPRYVTPCVEEYKGNSDYTKSDEERKTPSDDRGLSLLLRKPFDEDWLAALR